MEEIMMKELPKEERPRERLMIHGANQLSNAELLAIIFRTGVKNQSVMQLAQRVLRETNGLKHLDEVSVNELTEIPGIGMSKAVQLLASIEIGKRVSQNLVKDKLRAPAMTGPQDCFDLLHEELKYLKQEHFIVLSLDVKQKLIAKDVVFIGAVDTAIVHPREVFRIAMKRMAAYVICVHNHPSGDVTPSEADILATNQLVDSGLIVGIPVLDHVIIGGNDYSSLKAYGHL